MGAKLDGGVGAVARSNADRVPRRLGGNAWQREHCENVHRGRPEKDRRVRTRRREHEVRHIFERPGVTSLVVAILLMAACSSAPPVARTGKIVTSQHRAWTIRVVPSSLGNQWRARVQVWPPDVRPENHGGINLSFVESAASESAIVQAATAAARGYIDASQSVHQERR